MIDHSIHQHGLTTERHMTGRGPITTKHLHDTTKDEVTVGSSAGHQGTLSYLSLLTSFTCRHKNTMCTGTSMDRRERNEKDDDASEDEVDEKLASATQHL